MSKILISIDDTLLSRLDKAAAQRRLSRSTYVTQIVEAEVGNVRGPGIDRRSIAAMRRVDHLFSEHPVTTGPTAAIRAARDAR